MKKEKPHPFSEMGSKLLSDHLPALWLKMYEGRPQHWFELTKMKEKSQ
jgi:hypothetical protein